MTNQLLSYITLKTLYKNGKIKFRKVIQLNYRVFTTEFSAANCMCVANIVFEMKL